MKTVLFEYKITVEKIEALRQMAQKQEL